MTEQKKSKDDTTNIRKAKNCSVSGCSSCTKIRLLLLAVILIAILISLIKPAFSGEGTWPKSFETPNGVLTLYQPQPESYDSNAATIEARAALSFKKTGDPAPKFGAILFTAQYEVDRDTRTALLKNIQLKEWKFPDSTQEQADKLQSFINNIISNKTVPTSLDELIQSLKGAENSITSEDRLQNKPPRIIYRETPAALVILDGQPINKQIEGTKFQRTINTPYMMLYSNTDKAYYLNGNNSWFSANDINGEWLQAKQLPAGLQETADAQGLKEIEHPDNTSSIIPEIIISEEPAELISVAGKPDYSQVDGAGLLYVNNTSSVLILDISEQDYYTLISGRWFTSKSLADGATWTYVESSKIPPEFNNIPNNDKTATLRAAIPGTSEANDAILDATIPQTAEVQRNSPSPEVSYDGNPEFEGTGAKDVDYAVNSPATVIKFGNTYYLCEDGIWYKSSSPTGPWEVCTTVPGAIYEIPPECPIYNVTYVRVYNHTPEVVYVGYTPGYMGSYICNGVVVYGTGYYYKPWYGAYYYPRPATWGFAVRYNPNTGSWGFGIGYRPYGGGGFYFGISSGGVWYGGGMRSGWWGRGGYYDRNVNINIDNSINIGNGSINRDNIYKDRDRVKTLQDRRDSLSPEQKEARKDQAKTRRDNLSPEQKGTRKNRLQDRKANGNTPTRDNNQAQTRDRINTTLQPVRDKSAAQQHPNNKASNWQQSKRSNTVYSDKNGDIYRSNKATNDWQKMDNNGKWSNTKPSISTRQSLNRSQSNRHAGATKQYQTQQRQTQQRTNTANRSRPSRVSRESGGRRTRR